MQASFDLLTAGHRGRNCLLWLPGAIVGLGCVTLLIAMQAMGLWGWDLTIPLRYANPGHDEIWQLVLSKVLVDTGWILDNPFLGAPDIAHWHYHAAAQTSAFHSVIMRGLALFIDDAVKVQQVYYLLNFPLIAVASFFACRLLGIGVVPALAVGLLFPFTTYRITHPFYAFLANYFAIPLAVVPVYWLLLGELRMGLGKRRFLLGLGAIVLVAVSDGYYAFFTLMLFGFATAIGTISGVVRRPGDFVVPAVYILALIGVVLLLATPLREYKRDHRAEFFPAGVEDPTLVKHPFEAEIYVPSLKLLIAPHPDHRVRRIAELGNTLIATSNANRRVHYVATVGLGILGTLLLAAALALAASAPLRRQRAGADTAHDVADDGVVRASVSLALFILLCSIAGGIGTLVALVFPTIRAYDRFPLFLIFVLYAGAAAALSHVLMRARDRTKWMIYLGLGVTCTLVLIDQIPTHSRASNPAIRDLFLAERRVVQRIESEVPKGAFVYQYPYSQYLTDNKHYGWGVFSHLRLYLHSKGLRWSNGASKNSPVDAWHARIAKLPARTLFGEIQAAGFSAIVVDRGVVGDAEYASIRPALEEFLDGPLVEDAASKLAYGRLASAWYRLVYDERFREVVRIEVADRSRVSMKHLPSLINAAEFGRVLAASGAGASVVIERASHPTVFLDASTVIRGMGDAQVVPPSDMVGALSCPSATPSASRGDTVRVTVRNDSAFGWKMGAGRYPIGIGIHILGADGKMLRFDDGFRIPIDKLVAQGTSAEVDFPLSSLSLKGIPPGVREVIAELALVQDGHAWFGAISCRVPIRL